MASSGVKKILSVFLIVVLSFIVSDSQIAAGASSKAAFGVSAQTSRTTQVGTVSATVLNVRAYCSSRAKIVGYLAKGAEAYIITGSQGWYQITFNSGTGWVSGTYLTDIHPITGIQASSASSGDSPASSVPSAASAGGSGSSSGVSSLPASSSAASFPAASEASGTSSSSASSGLSSRVVAGYYTSWSAYSGFTPDKLDAAKIDIVNYAFAGIGSDLKIEAGDPSVDYSNFSKLNALKSRNPRLITVISIGGWDGSAGFSDAALTDSSRSVFTQSCVNFIKQYGFDGVDIDWEYPVSGGCAGRPEDKTDFTLLMKALREALNAQGAADGRHYYLSFAGGASNSYISNVQLSALAAYVDYAVDMTYDLHGPWDAYTDLNAPLYTPGDSSPQYRISVDSSVSAWLNAGFPANKLIMGIPFYGYIYSGVGPANSGLYQKFSSARSIGYDSIAGSYLSDGSYAKMMSSAGQVPYLYGNGYFISYDDAASIAAKARYASFKGLMGVSAWELGYDRNYTLLQSAYNNLG